MKQERLFEDDGLFPKKETQYDRKKKAIPFRHNVREVLPSYIAQLSGTGHRPDKLGGYHKLEQNERIIVPQLVEYLHRVHSWGKEEDSDKILVISGMAQGWDTWLALAALDSGVCHLLAAVPCIGQESPWPAKAQDKHRMILQKAHQVVYVCESYDYDSMQLRNEYMVDNSTAVLAMWNGTSGGTKNCIDYIGDNAQAINFWEEYSPLLVF